MLASPRLTDSLPLRRPGPGAGPARPLVVRLRNWVGDVVLSVPTLQRLERAGYRLTLVGKRWAADLLAGHGWRVHELEGSWRARVAQLRALRDAAVPGNDAGSGAPLDALVFPYSFSSALEMRLAGLRAVGYAHEGRGLLLAHSVARPALRHEMAVYWHLGSALLGAPAPAPAWPQLQLAPAHLEQAAALRRRHALRAGYVVICPFAGGTFDKLDKAWPGFADYAARVLPPLGRDVAICPGPGDEEALAARDYAGCVQLRGIGLGAYAALLRDAALVVANDTGPGHLAAAVGAPLVSVLGPTDAAQWGARGPRVHIVQGHGGWPSGDAVHAAALELLAAG